MKIIKALSASLVASIALFSCKKNETPVDHTLSSGHSTTDYRMPDTTHPVAGNYFVKFKDSFIPPYASVYKGDRTVRGARAAGAMVYEREAKAAIFNQLKNADGSEIVPASAIKGFVSNLVVGFEAYLDGEALRKIVANPQVEFVELQVLQKVIESAEGVKEVKKISAAQAQTVDALRGQVGYKDASSITKYCWILDSGVDPTHPDLKSDLQYAKNFSTSLYNFDVSGHGTEIAGVMAAKNNSIGTRGVAAGATIAPVKVINDVGESTAATVIKGLNHAWQYGEEGDVVNLSLSFATSSGNYTSMESAIRQFKGYKTYFAVSAGNQYADAKTRTPARMSWSGYTYNNDMIGWFFTIASYRTNYAFATNFLPYYQGGSNYGAAVDYAAPGYGIYSTTKNGGYVSNLAGTSLSTPIAAGILLLNNGVIWSKLFTTVEPKSNTKYKVVAVNP